MREVFDTYGGTIVLVILSSGLLVMYCILFGGSGSFVSGIADAVFAKSTSEENSPSFKWTNVSTNADGVHVVDVNGNEVTENQQKSALLGELIAQRLSPAMQGLGTQNVSGSAAIIGETYKTTQLMRGMEDDRAATAGADGSITLTCESAHATDRHGHLRKPITKSISAADTAIQHADASVVHDTKNELSGTGTTLGYFRVMTVTTGNGDHLISDIADISKDASGKANGIAYASKTYDHKKGRSGDMSSVTSDDFFTIYNTKGEKWLTYDGRTQQWVFYKAGTYCFRCMIVDSYGKSATGTVYVSVSREITQN